jgi:hypothetical protein
VYVSLGHKESHFESSHQHSKWAQFLWTLACSLGLSMFFYPNIITILSPSQYKICASLSQNESYFELSYQHFKWAQFLWTLACSFGLSMSFYPNPIFFWWNWDKVMINWTDILWMKRHGQSFFLGATGVTANKWRPSFITKKLWHKNFNSFSFFVEPKERKRRRTIGA